MYKAKLKHGKQIKDYIQTSSLPEVQDRFNGRLLLADESFELLWLVEPVYRCKAGETIHIREKGEVAPSEGYLEIEGLPLSSDGTGPV